MTGYLRRLSVLASVAALAWSCGDDGGPTAKTSATGGSGGGGTGGAAPASQKPACVDPGTPTGGAPLARADPAGALSEDGLTMVMFGGDVGTVICGEPIPKREHVGDTWLLDTACGEWTELSIGGPSARSRHSMVSDHKRSRAIMFGGRWRDNAQTMGTYTLYNDVWAFDFATSSWSEIVTGGTPPTPRYNTTAVIDGDELLVFGGGTSTSGLSFGISSDLHALNLDTGQWRVVTPQGGPPPARIFHAAAYDPIARTMFITQGGDENAFLGPFIKDLWALDIAGNTWHQLSSALPAAHDNARIKLGFGLRVSADDVEPNRLVLFSGHDDGTLGNRNDMVHLDYDPATPLADLGAVVFSETILGDTFNNPSTGQCAFPADFVIPDLAIPERRSAFVFVPHAGGEAFVVFGGDTDCGRANDAWWFDTRAGTWTPIKESIVGLTCPRTGNPSCTSMCG